MKHKLKTSAIAAIVASGCIAGIAEFPKAESSAIAMTNVEALSSGEDNFDECQDGCSTENHGKYCCTILGHKLYFPYKDNQ